jgi:hypothetical protein
MADGMTNIATRSDTFGFSYYIDNNQSIPKELRNIEKMAVACATAGTLLNLLANKNLRRLDNRSGSWRRSQSSMTFSRPGGLRRYSPDMKSESYHWQVLNENSTSGGF